MESQPQNPEFRNNPENFHPWFNPWDNGIYSMTELQIKGSDLN